MTMQAIIEALADVARAITEAVQAFMDTLRAALKRSADRRRSIIRRRDHMKAAVPVDPYWPPRGRPRPHPPGSVQRSEHCHYRVRPGDIPDRYGNYPY